MGFASSTRVFTPSWSTVPRLQTGGFYDSVFIRGFDCSMGIIRSRLKRDKNRVSNEVPARQTVAPVEATDQRSNTVISYIAAI